MVDIITAKYQYLVLINDLFDVVTTNLGIQNCKLRERSMALLMLLLIRGGYESAS